MATYDECVDAWERACLRTGKSDGHNVRKKASYARRLSAYLGGRDVEDITAFEIEDALDDLLLHGGTRNGGGPLSGTTVNYMFKHGKAAVRWAVRHDMARSNPFDRADNVSKDTPEMRPLSAEQLGELRRAVLLELDSCMTGRFTRTKAKDAACCMFLLIAACTGMRRGEACALDWGCFDGRRIHVRRAVKANGTIGRPKTAKGTRSITAPETLRNVLCAYRSWQGDMLGGAPGDDAPMLADYDGGRVSPNTVSHYWSDFRECIGLRDVHIHQLRHTHATLLISNGVDVKTVQERLGHSSASMTLDVYSHAVPENDEAAADVIEKLAGEGE